MVVGVNFPWFWLIFMLFWANRMKKIDENIWIRRKKPWGIKKIGLERGRMSRSGLKSRVFGRMMEKNDIFPSCSSTLPAVLQVLGLYMHHIMAFLTFDHSKARIPALRMAFSSIFLTNKSKSETIKKNKPLSHEPKTKWMSVAERLSEWVSGASKWANDPLLCMSIS